VRLRPFGCVPASLKVTRGADTLCGVATRRGEGVYECFLGVTCVFFVFFMCVKAQERGGECDCVC
jgi:hypothetical protein